MEAIVTWLTSLFPQMSTSLARVLVHLVYAGIISFVAPVVVVVAFTYMERKVIARIQDRVGPNRAGPLGVLQGLADAVKMLTKEDITPVGADRFVYNLSPGLAVLTYGTVYVAQVAFAADMRQALRFAEAEAHPGPSLVVGYAHCIAHGFDMSRGLEQMKRAVACGHWPLFRYNPAREAEGKSPLVVDSKPPSIAFAEYAGRENRYRALQAMDPALAERLMLQAEADVRRRWAYLQHLARWAPGAGGDQPAPP